MSTVGNIGHFVLEQWRKRNHVAAVAGSVVIQALRPGNWPRTVRNVLARQILFGGVEAVPFISQIAFFIGISIVVQAQLWIGQLGQSQLLGPLLVAVVIRELGPLLANLVMVGRSGNAIAAELGNMKISGEVRALDAQGLDPLTYLVMPRVVGMSISVFCLAIIFILATLLSGYLFGALMNPRTESFTTFVDGILGALQGRDVFSVLAKCLVPALLSSTISCIEGLSVSETVAEVPQATTRSFKRSIITLFVTSALLSLITYL